MTKKSAKSKSKKSESTSLVLKSVQDQALRVKEAFQAGPLFQDNPAEVDLPIGVAAWSILDRLEELIKQRKLQYRAHFLAKAEAEGKPTFDKKTREDKGGQYLVVDGSEVIREKRESKLPEENAVKLLLAVKSIPIMEVFDEVKTVELNATKLKFMVDTGRLSKKEVNDLKKVDWALKVKPSDVIDECLADMSDKILGHEPMKKLK